MSAVFASTNPTRECKAGDFHRVIVKIYEFNENWVITSGKLAIAKRHAWKKHSFPHSPCFWKVLTQNRFAHLYLFPLP